MRRYFVSKKRIGVLEHIGENRYNDILSSEVKICDTKELVGILNPRDHFIICRYELNENLTDLIILLFTKIENTYNKVKNG